MKVYRCDRCGNHYTQREHSHTINIFEFVDDRKEPRNLLCIMTQTGSALDLCPNCMISLINWINRDIQSGYVSKTFAGGRKFGYEFVEDINCTKKHEEVEEDDNI